MSTVEERMSTTRLDPRQALPLWAQLASLLRQRLLAGEYAERFPSEADLTAEFEVSRATVREAIRRLREEGLLDARRGRGTFVVRRQLDEPVIGTTGLAPAIAAAGLEEESRVLEVAELPATAEVAAALGLASGEPIVWLERLRVAGGQPLALDRSALRLEKRCRRRLLDAELGHGSLYEFLASCCDITVTGATEHTRAVTCSAADRSLLQLAGDEGVLEVERVAYSGTRPVELRRSLFRGSAYIVEARWGTVPDA
jgi:GntR family transcriptional regulator